MSVRRRAPLALLAAVLAAAAVTLGPVPAGGSADPVGSDQSAAGPAGLLAEARARATLRKMTLPEKVGQLFVTHVYGADATTPDERNVAEYGVATPAEVIQKYHLGGVIYFAWSNPTNEPEQVAELSNGLQHAAVDDRPHIPLLVSTDQETGVIVRMGPPATQFPGNMAVGAGRSAADARTSAAVTGAELKAMGVNQNFGPVADVNVNPLNPVIGVRSFSSDPELAADLTAAAVRGYERDARISATPKHFPGHGDTETDSHTGIPEIDHTRAEWEELDAPPFEAAIDAGVDSIMTAHIVVPSLDPAEDPATLSKPIMTGILRQELGYDGVVITDSLGMAGVRDKYGDDEVPLLAIEAGVDQLLRPPEMDLAYSSVLDAVRNGRISEQRLDKSVLRILTLKFKKGLFRNPYVNVGKVDDRVGTPEHLAIAEQITDRTVTAIKNDADLLPLSDEPRSVLVTGYGQTATATLGAALAEHGATPTVASTGSQPTDAAIADAVAKAQTHDLTVVLTMKAWDVEATDPEARQQRLVHELVATGKPVIVVAVYDPYDIAHFTEAPTFLSTYSFNVVSMPSLAKVLYGEVSPTGELPVDIPRADDPSTVLYPFGHGLTW
jgi:beta-N-acetylhexosaminidase